MMPDGHRQEAEPQYKEYTAGRSGESRGGVHRRRRRRPDQAEARKAPVMIRFDRDLLQRVDAAAKRRGISRSAWVQYTVSRALDTGEG